MIVLFFFLSLFLTVTVTNKRNEAAPTDKMLEFEKSDSLIIFLCFVSSIVLQLFAPKIKFVKEHFMVFSSVCGGLYLMVLIIVNNNREKKIKYEHDQILKIYQSLADILGHVDPEDVDFANTPFEWEEDKKLKTVSQIIIDTSVSGLRINDNTIIYAQYSLNKYFPELQWTSEHDAPNRQLIYRGLPKPPSIAYFPGSDYRPAEWIPLGVGGGNVEICWNLADVKDYGKSSYVSEDGERAETLKLPSAPQSMVLGSPLSLDTIIPTTDGYKTMAEIDIGDVVFDINNKASKVIGMSDIHMSEDMYKMTLKNELDTMVIKSDGQHKFPVFYNGQRQILHMYEIFHLYQDDLKLFGNDILWEIDSIEEIENELVKCIQIESETHLFLITDEQNKEDEWELNPLDYYKYKACGTSNTGGGKSIWVDQMVDIKD